MPSDLRTAIGPENHKETRVFELSYSKSSPDEARKLGLDPWQDQTGPDTLIKYMTDGMLLREILSDDEADLHGHTLVLDLCFYCKTSSYILITLHFYHIFGHSRPIFIGKLQYSCVAAEATSISHKSSFLFCHP